MKNNSHAIPEVSYTPVDVFIALILTVPAIFSILHARIVKTIGYLIFAFGSISPEIYEKITFQEIPHSVKLLLKIQLVLHSIFGQFFDFYDLVWWDKLLHFLGSASIAFFFYHALSVDSKFWKAEKRSIFNAFLLANFAGVLWEIAEFIADELFHLNAQPSLHDTMLDLIFNLTGAYFASKLLLKSKTGSFISKKRVLKN